MGGCLCVPHRIRDAKSSLTRPAGASLRAGVLVALPLRYFRASPLRACGPINPSLPFTPGSSPGRVSGPGVGTYRSQARAQGSAPPPLNR